MYFKRTKLKLVYPYICPFINFKNVLCFQVQNSGQEMGKYLRNVREEEDIWGPLHLLSALILPNHFFFAKFNSANMFG